LSAAVITKPRSGYLPSLDGWRAIAVLGVTFTHDYDHHLGKHNLSFLHDYGGVGVLLFFAISGILITTRILEEEQLRGHFDLRGFYTRRLFRIQPAAIAYLLVGAVMVCFGFALDGSSWKYWWGSMLFFRNYLPHGGGGGPFTYFATAHFWTLAVEEHFYLLLSLLLFFVKRRRVAIFTTCVAASFLLPSILIHLGWTNPATAAYVTQNNLHYLLWPALCAVLLQLPRVRTLAVRYVRPWNVLVLVIAIYAVHRLCEFHRTGLDLWGFVNTFVNLFPIMLIGTMLQPRSWTTRLLETRPFRFVGRISYSLYLWHVVFFINRWSPDASFPNTTPHWFTHYPWNYLPAFACAIASYYLLEKPMMRLGHRLAPPATPGRPDLMSAPALSTAAPTH
jgi:peptidoglycan/LPS O-acetylase OafA/YrhL